MKKLTEEDLKIEYKGDTGLDANIKTVSFLIWCQEQYLKLRNELEMAEEYVHNMVCDEMTEEQFHEQFPTEMFENAEFSKLENHG